MELERILSVLNENRIRATIDAVAGLADVSAGEIMEALIANPAAARWVVASESWLPIVPNGHDHGTPVDENPIVIRDIPRLRGLVLATELTGSLP